MSTVRMLLESKGQYKSQWATIVSIADKADCTVDSLRFWIRQHERYTFPCSGAMTARQQRGKDLEGNIRGHDANEIPRLANAFFSQAKRDRRFKCSGSDLIGQIVSHQVCRSSTQTSLSTATKGGA